MTEQILTSLDNGVLTVTFNRPSKKNAFTREMYEGLIAAFSRAETEKEIRVLVLRGAGGAFTGGNDLGDFMNAPPTGEDSVVFRFLKAITTAEKPVIAQVEGPAVGIGTTLLLHTDMVYCAEDAKFVLPFVNLGLVPEAASSFLMPRIMGHQRAAELLMFGEPFDAQTARELGFVNRIVAKAELEGFVNARAQQLAAQPLGAITQTKRLLREGAGAQVQEALHKEGALFIERLTSPEAQEAFMAFFEKRKPDFRKIES